jgi:hypothetical protein
VIADIVTGLAVVVLAILGVGALVATIMRVWLDLP